MPQRPQIHRPAGYRPRAAQADYDRRRPSAHARGYDEAWRRTRAAFLAQSPLCQDCEAVGHVEAAVEVHHVKKLADFPHLKHDFGNLMGLCRRHHNLRTRKGE